ncbi:hypothetical protein Tco_0898797 [Tanacetum coccineum]
MMAVVVLMSRWWWRLETMGMARGARGSADRVDRAERSNFGLGQKTRRKSFSAVANGGGGDDGRWLPEIERDVRAHVFKLDKKKRFKLTLEVFRDIFQICSRVQGRDIDPLPSKEDTIGLSGKTSGLDKLRLSRAQILWGMYYQKNVDYVELLWEDFIYQIDNRVYKKQEKINKIGMHTSKDDYLINTLRFVSAKEATQIYGGVLPDCLTSPKMKESKAYKTYLGYATGVVPPRMARKFKKAYPSKKHRDQVPIDEELVQKGKRVKRPAKKSTTMPTAGIVIRETPVETKTKRKENVDVTRGKGIELLSEVALTEEAQMKEENESDENETQFDSVKGSDSENESEEHESDSEQEEEVKDDDKEEDEFVHTPSHTDDMDEDNLQSKSDDVNEGDEEKGMDDTTNQFDDDMDSRLNEPTQTDKEVVQDEGADAEMNDAAKRE